ncbi:MAG: hypothetical protein VB858_15680, partial [Planctomycetaceae bacterium]
QIYVSGCSGDVTAGKYNDGSQANRELLANRLYVAMQAASAATVKHALKSADVRVARLDLPYRQEEQFQADALLTRIHNDKLDVRQRIHAAMSLSSRMRVVAGAPIDLPVVDLGAAQIVLFPGEAFVGYQLMAQEMRPDKFVLSIGYGECWPGYIPTKSSVEDKFEDTWLWVAPGCEEPIRTALKKTQKG